MKGILNIAIAIIICPIIIFAAVALIGCSESATTAPPTTPQAYLVKEDSGTASYTEFGHLIIEGVVVNQGNKRATSIEAEVTFYDSDKNILGRYSDYLGELGVGQSWRYSIMYLGVNEKDVGTFSVDVTYHW